MYRFLKLVAVAVLFFLTSCSSVFSPTPPASPTKAAISYQVTVTATTGAVVGVLKIRKGAGEVPVKNVRLYLGDILKDASGQERASSFDRVSSPTTITDEDGRFVFVDLPPGRYTLILDTIINSYLLFEPGKTEALIITVEAGKVTDLGVLVYDKLPVSVEGE